MFKFAGRQVFDIFDGDKQKLLADKDFMKALRVWTLRWPFTNMSKERLLAFVNRCVSAIQWKLLL